MSSGYWDHCLDFNMSCLLFWIHFPGFLSIAQLTKSSYQLVIELETMYFLSLTAMS